MKAKIILFFKGMFKGRSTHRTHLGADPFGDWRILVSIFLVVVVFFAYGAFYVWRAIDRGEIFQVPQTDLNNQDTLNRESLDKIIELFESKERQFSKIKIEGTGISDPSI